MSQSQIEIAMQEFQQISRDVQEQQGIGLGLALARQIIELHGGELELKSSEGEGTQAIVRLSLHG
jgi:cell cycle sensor histidine kinase DivJ